jgi:hypothetical protein
LVLASMKYEVRSSQVIKGVTGEYRIWELGWREDLRFDFKFGIVGITWYEVLSLVSEFEAGSE